MASLLKVQFHFHLSSAFEQIEPLALQTSPAPSPRFRPPPFCNFWLLLCVQICFFKVICPADWASPTRRTGAWVDSGSWWWTRRPGVLWFMGLQRVGHDWATELNWTELNCCSIVERQIWHLASSVNLLVHREGKTTISLGKLGSNNNSYNDC